MSNKKSKTSRNGTASKIANFVFSLWMGACISIMLYCFVTAVTSTVNDPKESSVKVSVSGYNIVKSTCISPRTLFDFLTKGSTPTQEESFEMEFINQTGSGTVIKYDGEYLYVLTAAHVVRCDTILDITIEFFTDETNSPYAQPREIVMDEVYKIDLAKDLAIIRGTFKNYELSVAKTPSLSQWYKDINELVEVYSFGFPLGSSLRITEGIISNVDPVSGRFYATTFSIPGSSGGGIYVKHGNTYELVGVSIGVTIAGKQWMPHDSLFVGYKELSDFLRGEQ